MNFLRRSRSLALVACSMVAAGGSVAADIDVTSLAWMAGCWSAEQGEAGTGEHWLRPAGGTMLGVSRTVKNGKTVAFEFMQLRHDAGGKLVLIALPSGQQQTTFTAVASERNSVTFENPSHDFPQKVIYRLQPGGKLTARIEGMRGGKLRGIDFPMQRAACAEAAL